MLRAIAHRELELDQRKEPDLVARREVRRGMKPQAVHALGDRTRRGQRAEPAVVVGRARTDAMPGAAVEAVELLGRELEVGGRDVVDVWGVTGAGIRL